MNENKTPITIYTTGYSGQKQSALMPMLEAMNATLVDIRFNPYSRAKIWQQASFREACGERYTHVKALGNAGYQSGTIEIHNMTGGLEWIAKAVSEGKTLILMCACSEHEGCHREHIAEILFQHHYEVVEIEDWEVMVAELKGETPQQVGIFE